MNHRAAPRLDRLLPVIVAALAFGAAAALSRPYAVGVFHDDGVYAILAKSLATGQGYRYLHLPGAPAATHYPPGYPLLLAALWRLAPAFPANVSLLLLANAVCLGSAAVGTLLLAERVLGWPRRAAAIAAVVGTLSYPLLMLSTALLSEPLFAALLLPALVVAERAARADGKTRSALLGGALAGVLMLVRAHGIALSMALVGMLVARRRWRDAALCALAACVVLAPWEIWLSLHHASLAEPLRGSYGSYGAWLADGARSGGIPFIAGTALANARETIALLADRFSLSDRASIRLCVGSIAAGAIVLGALRCARRAPITVAFMALYFAILLVWPFTPWRYVFAVWPLAVLFTGEIVAVLRDRAVAIAPRVALAAVAALLALGVVKQETRVVATRRWFVPANAATAQIAPLVGWVASSTAPTDLVAVDGEQLVYLFTGRHAVPVAPFTAAEYLTPRSVGDNAASLRQLLGDLPITFVATIAPSLRASAERLVAAGASRREVPRLVPIGSIAAGGAFRVERQ